MWRWCLAGLAACACLATSCSGDGESAEPSPTSATAPAADSTTTTTTVALSTTTTIDPTSTSIICGSGTPLLEPDLDGDGEPEGVFVVETGGGQALYVCDGPIVNDRSLELAYGVWYVAAADLDADGTDELFLGASTIADLPGRPDAWLLPVDASGPELTIVVDDPDSPADVSLDDLEYRRVSPPPAICEVEEQSDFAERVDLDGDGLDDLVVQGRLDHGSLLLDDGVLGSPSVVACLASGEVDELAYGGMGEVFGVGAGPDGAPLVWTGGTTVSAAFVAPVQWRDGRLDFLRDIDGVVFGLTDGFPAVEDEGRILRSGCGDLDGDGIDEFVQIEADDDGSVWRWRRDAWHIVDGVAVPAWADTGTLDASAFDGAYDAVAALANDTCEGARG